MEKVSFVIDDAVASIIRAPLVTPFRIATGQHDELENVFLRLCAGDGTCGYGEAAVATHITGETVADTLDSLQSAAHALRGRRISDPVAVCREFAPAFAGNHAGLAALEMAVLDLSARLQGIPFHRLFTPLAQNAPVFSFATDITVVIGTVEQARQTALDFAQRGFKTFKIKVGADESIDLQRVLAVREAAPGCEIVLDANMGFNATRMLAFLERLDAGGARPALLEQPVPKEDWEGLCTITKALEGSDILVCADESVGSVAAARRAIEMNAVSAINIKFMKSGILDGAEIARLAVESGKRLMLGAMMESSLAITASAHFAAGLGCIDFIDLDTTFFLSGEMGHSPYLDATGRFDLEAAGPGIGVEPEFP
ncbi:dipeptide epimerase [Geomonas terrae]|uniref:Dipeptide epimerase n=1 Tax=Geomonas terrae TaxID=2562681 RepID=A0A4S1CE86_9BACT|nr:dipeptide epimerase [Geomonas terrae]TGU71741.1 dipeptide epimerase [Geomonas terrae]